MSLHMSAESSSTLDKQIPQAESSCVQPDLRDQWGFCSGKGRRGVFQFQPG